MSKWKVIPVQLKDFEQQENKFFAEALCKLFNIPYELYEGTVIKAGTGNRTFKTMSWSVYLIGTPAAIVCALKKQSENLNGDSKAEFDEVLPSLVKLVESNYSKTPSNYGSTWTNAFKLTASGHRDSQNSNCYVSFEPTGCNLVTDTGKGSLEL